MLTKSLTHIFFDVRKSSFGEHKFVDGLEQHTVNTKRWKNAKRNVGLLPDVLYLGRTNLLKADVVRFLNVLIRHSRASRRIFKGLKADIKVMVPKRRFWKAEQTFGNVFSKHFSKERSPNRVLTYLYSHRANR